MTMQVYRDIAAADGCEAIAKLVFYLTAHGFTYVAHGTGTAGARSASQPATAADLATALRTAPSAWVCVSRGARAWSWQRSTGANPDYRAWRFEYTPSGALTAGSATAPDRHATNSQYVSGNYFRTIAPGALTGASTTNDAMKCHFVIDDAGPTFALLTRRTPLPAGNVGAAGMLFSDALSQTPWAGNPDPVILGNVGNDNNAADVLLLSSGFCSTYSKYGLAGASWLSTLTLENPGSVAGSTTSDPGGGDVLFGARWVGGTAVWGKSTLFELIQPGRTPVVGIDSGGTLTRAAFWTVAVLNDGVALGS